MATIITGDDIDPEEPEPDGHKPSGDDQVGYGKPPKHSQFKPGNKRGKGRKKGSKNLKTIVNEALGMKRPAKVDGQIKKLSKIEVANHQLANAAAEGDHKSIMAANDYWERFGPQEDPEGPSRHQTKANLETLREYLELWDMFKGNEEDGAHA